MSGEPSWFETRKDALLTMRSKHLICPSGRTTPAFDPNRTFALSRSNPACFAELVQFGFASAFVDPGAG